jgi:hypothetical protein
VKATRDWKAGLKSVPCDIGIALEIPGDAPRIDIRTDHIGANVRGIEQF